MPTSCAQQIEPRSLPELLALPPAEIAAVDIGRANLLCAEGLPGADDLHVDQHVRRLDAWAERVRRKTERYLPNFHTNADRFDFSEPKWRLLAMAKVLRDECGIGYHLERIDSEPDWTDSQDLFLHGLTGPRRTGTCPSLPVLVVAICRRLGYPMCLSHTPGHCFSRWDGKEDENPAWRERFNIEFSGGIAFYDDENFYDFPISWPAWAREQHRRGDPACEFLHSFTPAQELAHSLCQRGVCLEAIGRHTEAVNVYYQCRRYDQRWGGYLDFAKRTLRSRAVEVMRSIGLEPEVIRHWCVGDAMHHTGCCPPDVALPLLVPSANGMAVLSVAPPSTRGSGVTGSSCANSHGTPPANLASILQMILHRTCEGTPARPSFDLLFAHPPEPKVDPYVTLRDKNGRVQFA